MENKPLLYKGKMLARKDNVIYYGNPEDKFIIVMDITSTEQKNGFEITTGVTVSLRTNNGSTRERVIKKVDREGIYKALDIAEYWLEDALNGEM